MKRRLHEQKLVRRAGRHIGDARFLVYHQYLNQAKLKAWQAINELEIALLPRPPIRWKRHEFDR